MLVKGSRLGRRLADGRIQPEKRHQNDNSVFEKVLQHSLQMIRVLHRGGPALHNVHFGYYVYLPTEQAETYLKVAS